MKFVHLSAVLLSFALQGQHRLTYDPFAKGAMAEISVSDDEGMAVGGAEVSVWFEVSSVKSEERR